MPFVVFDEGFRWVVKSALSSSGRPPSFLVEFCSGEDDRPYYTTTEVNGKYIEALKSVSLWVICPEENAIRPCTHVNWKRVDNGQVVYKVIYNTALPSGTIQVCNIVLNVSETKTNKINYICVPTELLSNLIDDDYPGVLALEMQSLVGSPKNVTVDEFYVKFDDVGVSEDPLQLYVTSSVRVKLSSGQEAILVQEPNGAYYLVLEIN